MQTFIYEAQIPRVIFGSGTMSRIAEEVTRLGASRAIVLSTPGRGKQLAAAVADQLGGICVAALATAVMHAPVQVSERAVDTVRETGADAIVAVGGGSTTGLAKAIALRTQLPQIILPTTYAGSEMTAVLGETADGRKITRKSPYMRAKTVIYDIDLSLDVPASVSVSSAMNAIAHGVEALYARDGNPVISNLAEDGIRSLVHALPPIMRDLTDRTARWEAMYGAFLCGAALGATTMGLQHKLAHILGGAFNLPHAETHSVLLPHVVAFNAPATPLAMQRLSRAIGEPDPAQALYALARRLDAPRSLKELGMPENGVDLAVQQAIVDPYDNPVPVEPASLRDLVRKAWSGATPYSS
ncbi:maleylacetate reductase [Rhodoligotrophos ferricapiens]|uniref:maleylacetate reductase n=1 Tax=Rhodoligotrophos ferricapiens TaxID=3069264 RepID=UPI00315DB5AE